jgi:putative membrane protein
VNPIESEQWQRLAPLALVFLVLNGIQKFIRENLYAFAGAGAGFAFIDWLGPRELLLAALAVLLIICASALIFHRRFRFRLESDAIRVRRGLFEKKELRIRFARVQNIQLGQPFYFRPFGLVRFSLETPGASEKEVELPGIPRHLAETMRDRISGQQADRSCLAEADDNNQDEQEIAHGEVLFSPGTSRLFVHGMSSNQVWLLIGAAAWLVSQFSRRLERLFEDAVILRWLTESIGSVWPLIAFMLAAGLLCLLMLSGLISIVRFHAYRLLDRDDRLVGIGGLLDEREQTVKRTKMTGLTFKQSAIGRLLGSGYLLVRQTRSSDQEVPGARAGFLVPGLRRTDHGLITRIQSHWAIPSDLLPISRRFWYLLSLRWLIFGAIVLIALVVLLGRGHFWLPLPGLGLAAGPVLIYLRWRRWGWQILERQLWVRQGLLGQTLDVFDLDQVQQVRVLQSPYQRRHQLASLQLILPQGAVDIPFLTSDTAAKIANQALFAAETATTHRI